MVKKFFSADECRSASQFGDGITQAAGHLKPIEETAPLTSLRAGGQPFHTAQTNVVEFPGGPSFAPLFHAKGGGLDAASRTPHASARSQQGTPPVTTARNKVPVPLPIPPVPFVPHGLRHSCAPSPAARLRHPELQTQQQIQKPINFNVNYRSGIFAPTMAIQYRAKGWPTRRDKILEHSALNFNRPFKDHLFGTKT